jgi:hypothetical protein
MAGANDIEENGLIARLGKAAIDRVVARVDRVNDRARPQGAGEQNAGRYPATPHDATPARNAYCYLEYLCTAACGRQGFAAL